MKNSNVIRNAFSVPFNELANTIPVSNNYSKQIPLVNKSLKKNVIPEILFITSYPPRECGIATYSEDLIKTVQKKFGLSFQVNVCALETTDEKFDYPEIVSGVFDTSKPAEFAVTAYKINKNANIKIVVIQHEFGFYNLNEGDDFLHFIQQIKAPVIIVFHTVLPAPDNRLRKMVKAIAAATKAIVVMTETSRGVLELDYGIAKSKIEVIAHGTHLVSNSSKTMLKKKYGLTGHKVLSTFGLLSAGKSIETTLDALPAIIEIHPDVMFLIIGKTHPGVVKHEGEKYREMLLQKVESLQLEKHVTFINQYLNLTVLLEYLRLTDIYLFTSKDPNQSVSGTFSYAMSCGCPVISTPIPQAREMLAEYPDLLIGFQQPTQLAASVIKLFKSDSHRERISTEMLRKIAPTAWENSAIAHAQLFKKIMVKKFVLDYNIPDLNLRHIKQMTTAFGMLQFSKINRPDTSSGYTLDDNARAMIVICKHYEISGDPSDLVLLNTYLNFIQYCLQPDGTFLNYVDKHKKFTTQNERENLEDANGRANWALGYLISNKDILPLAMIKKAEEIFGISLQNAIEMFSTRAMAFNIKGLYYFDLKHDSTPAKRIIKILAERLSDMYEFESDKEWAWFESYLTYANSILPEAMIMAWQSVKEPKYQRIAKEAFDFLISKTTEGDMMKVISNKGWLKKGGESESSGEQPIDVAYTILALQTFDDIYDDEDFKTRIYKTNQWFLGNNHLNQIMYNPCTGGCYDGLEENQVNLNQGAESTLSYLLARLTIEKIRKNIEPLLQHSQIKNENVYQPEPTEKLLQQTLLKNALLT